MAWKVDFVQDESGKGGLGVATATYVVDTVTHAVYSREVDTGNSEDVSLFCSEAKAYLEKRQSIKAATPSYISKLFAELTKGG